MYYAIAYIFVGAYFAWRYWKRRNNKRSAANAPQVRPDGYVYFPSLGLTLHPDSAKAVRDVAKSAVPKSTN